jgi:hypothetical protein
MLTACSLGRRDRKGRFSAPSSPPAGDAVAASRQLHPESRHEAGPVAPRAAFGRAVLAILNRAGDLPTFEREFLHNPHADMQ